MEIMDELSNPFQFSINKTLEKVLNMFGGVSYENEHINKFTKSRLLTLLNQSKFNENNTIHIQIF